MADRMVTPEKANRTPNWDKWRLIPNAPYGNVSRCR